MPLKYIPCYPNPAELDTALILFKVRLFLITSPIREEVKQRARFPI